MATVPINSLLDDWTTKQVDDWKEWGICQGMEIGLFGLKGNNELATLRKKGHESSSLKNGLIMNILVLIQAGKVSKPNNSQAEQQVLWIVTFLYGPKPTLYSIQYS